MPEQQAKQEKLYAACKMRFKGVLCKQGSEIKVGPNRAEGEVPASEAELKLWQDRGKLLTKSELDAFLKRQKDEQKAKENALK